MKDRALLLQSELTKRQEQPPQSNGGGADGASPTDWEKHEVHAIIEDVAGRAAQTIAILKNEVSEAAEICATEKLERHNDLLRYEIREEKHEQTERGLSRNGDRIESVMEKVEVMAAEMEKRCYVMHDEIEVERQHHRGHESNMKELKDEQRGQWQRNMKKSKR